jgi:hypothetical protein
MTLAAAADAAWRGLEGSGQLRLRPQEVSDLAGELRRHASSAAGLPDRLGRATSLDNQLRPWTLSSTGPFVSPAAPGVHIQTVTLARRRAHADGTSDSSALTSAVIALVWSKYPQLTKWQAVARILTTARDLGARARMTCTGTAPSTLTRPSPRRCRPTPPIRSSTSWLAAQRLRPRGLRRPRRRVRWRRRPVPSRARGPCPTRRTERAEPVRGNWAAGAPAGRDRPRPGGRGPGPDLGARAPAAQGVGLGRSPGCWARAGVRRGPGVPDGRYGAEGRTGGAGR